LLGADGGEKFVTVLVIPELESIFRKYDVVTVSNAIDWLVVDA